MIRSGDECGNGTHWGRGWLLRQAGRCPGDLGGDSGDQGSLGLALGEIMVLGLGLVLDCDGLGPLVLVVGVAKGDAKLELLFRLGGTVELLPD